MTNFSVNKHSKNFVKNKKEEKDGEGSKWSLTALKKHYESIGIDSKKVTIFINVVVLLNKRCYYQNLHICGTRNARHLLKNSRKKKLWFRIIRF